MTLGKKAWTGSQWHRSAQGHPGLAKELSREAALVHKLSWRTDLPMSDPGHTENSY